MKKRYLFLTISCFLFLLCGCGVIVPQIEQTTQTETAMPVSIDSAVLLADSLDTAVIERVDEKNQTITFWNLQLAKSYTLGYDSSTGIKSRYDEELVAGQLVTGDVVQVSFIKDEKKAKNIWLDKTITVTENVSVFSINKSARTFEMNGERYSIDGQAAFLADGEPLELMEINQVDTLRVCSMDHTIYSIAISNGHGYVRLLGAEPFEGGWVEFGQSIIRRVEPDMLLVLPAGAYDMLISNNGNEGTAPVEVRANEETQVDVTAFVKKEETRTGGIVFTISPQEAELTIDGEETDYSSVVKLTYGIHQIRLKAEGYHTITRYIKVGEEMANVSIDMEETSDTESTADSNSSVSSNTVTATTEGYQVYIDAPAGAELYVDGKYIGLLPTSFDKKAGSYTVSVRKSGYTTRSYSLEVDNSEKDVHYSFSELEKAD